MTTKPYQGGLFSAPICTCVGDPFVENRQNEGHGMSKGFKQFGIGRGLPSEKKLDRLFEGEQYVPYSKVLAKQRMDGKAGFLTPNGFKHTSGLKKSSSAGDYYGTISKKATPHLPDGTYGDRTSKREKLIQTLPKNFLTHPAKKPAGMATCAATTPNILFSKVVYYSDDFDASLKDEKEREKRSRELRGDRIPFKIHSTAQLVPIDSESTVEIPPLNELTGAAKRAHLADTKNAELMKSFRPSSPSKSISPIYGAFNQYPEHVPDPLDEKAILRSKQSARNLPLALQMTTVSEKLRDRRSWTPTSPSKSMFTKSTVMMEIK